MGFMFKTFKCLKCNPAVLINKQWAVSGTVITCTAIPYMYIDCDLHVDIHVTELIKVRINCMCQYRPI